MCGYGTAADGGSSSNNALAPPPLPTCGRGGGRLLLLLRRLLLLGHRQGGGQVGDNFGQGQAGQAAGRRGQHQHEAHLRRTGGRRTHKQNAE